MLASTLWKRTIATVASGAAVVMVLNVEAVVQRFGLDQVLSGFLDVAPTWLSSVVEAVTSPTAFWVAVALICYVAGVWTNRLVDWVTNEAPEVVDFEQIADECSKTSRVLRAGAALFDLPDDERHVTGIWLQCWKTSESLGKAGIKIGFSFDFGSAKEATLLANILDQIVGAISQNDIAAAQQIAEEFNRDQSPRTLSSPPR